MNMNPIVDALLKSADMPSQASDDYIDPDDGLKYCGKCPYAERSLLPR